MALTLGNNLKGLVSREVDATCRKTSGLGESMTTGINKFAPVVNAFLGNSLRDSEIAINSITRDLSYSANMLNVADEYLKVIASLTQECLTIIASAAGKSDEKTLVLQAVLNSKKEQINMFVNSAGFDNKLLLNGSVRDLNVQVGKTSDDVIELNIINIGDGKLFRSPTAHAYNEYMRTNIGSSKYYVNQSELDIDYRENKNLLQLSEPNPPYVGSGTGQFTTWDQNGLILRGVLDDNPRLGIVLNEAAPDYLAAIRAVVPADPARDFSAATALQIVTAGLALQNACPVQPPAYMGGFLPEMTRIVYDNQPLILTTEKDQVVAADIIKGAVETVRRAQASISNQKQNIIEISGSLRATVNVTAQAADSYLKTDYVLTAQQYSESIRTMVASITSLQAANKIPEAAQRLLDGLARG
jgi:flagellin-like hook-associated protein FlgL